MTLQLAIVLPTLNERANLRALVERLDAAMGEVAWEAIIVDDNSPDGTADEARAISRSTSARKLARSLSVGRTMAS